VVLGLNRFHPDFDPCLDLDGDGVGDQDDIDIVLALVGQVCP